MINKQLIDKLSPITEEERSILSGDGSINRDIYYSKNENEVMKSQKLLTLGKKIDVRAHTRFAHFPIHSHDYVEIVYMCSGHTDHVINGKNVRLSEGELLMLCQSAKQEILPAGEGDIAVNFIVLPEFFDSVLEMLGEEDTPLRTFVIDCLKKSGDIGYLHFKVADVLPIQNLVENLIWSIRSKQPNKRSINQVTMGLLFLQLVNHIDRMETNAENQSQKLVIDVLGYIEEHYRDGELTQLAKLLNYDAYWLSKEIKKRTGKNYTELVQAKRLNQAAYLLEHTGMSVLDIGLAVGYDNQSYFHRIFQKRFQVSPKKYRDAHASVGNK